MSCDPVQQLGVALVSMAIGAGWAVWALAFLKAPKRKQETHTDTE